MPTPIAIQPTLLTEIPSMTRIRRGSNENVSATSIPTALRQPHSLESTTAPTKDADKQLAEIYRQVLLDFADGKSLTAPINEIIVDIPENSTFGKWRSLIGSILSSPDFTQWAEKNNVSLWRGITLSPKDNCIIAMVSGKAVHFPNASFSSFSLLMKVAEAFTPTFETTYNPVGASVKEVARFYGKSVPIQDAANTLRDRARTSAAELENGTAFSEVSHSNARSESECQLNYSALASLNEKQTLIQRLETFPNDGSQQMSDFLEKTSLEIHSIPALGRATSEEKEMVSLGEYINAQDWQLPNSADELKEFLLALKTPELNSPRYGDLGGALSWSIPLSNPRSLYIVILSRVSNPGRSGLLGYLSNYRQWEPHELRNPRRVIEHILQSPNAQELGNRLQDIVGGASSATSINDYLLAAIHEAFEPRLTPSRTNVAGFEIAQPGNRGLKASVIVERLADHLLSATSGTGHSRVSIDLAPVAAHLLLSKRAPEFLVKDIPDSVTYGSHAWMTFSTAVARIEAHSPGATSMTSYIDILRRGDLLNLTTEKHQVEQTVKLAALMDWGVANRLVALNPKDDYTESQQKWVLNNFQKQMAEVLESVNNKNAPLPIRADIGAKQLYEALGFNLDENQPYLNSLMNKLGIPGSRTENYRTTHGDKAPFYELINRKFITAKYYNKDFPGPYSLLDLHVSNRLFNPPPPGLRSGAVAGAENSWMSKNSAITFGEIFNTSMGFADAAATFSVEIHAYIESLKFSTKTTVKYLLSLLPEDDFRFIDQGALELYCEELIYEEVAGQRYLRRIQPANNKPVVARCNIGSEVRFYEINPQQGRIERRKDLENNFVVGHTQVKPVLPGKDTDSVEVSSYSQLPSALRHITKIGTITSSATPPAHNAYSCSRTNAIASLVTDNVFSGIPEKLEAYAKGSTTFEIEVPEYIKYREFFLNLIPLRSAIVNFSEGNFSEGIGDLSLDILGIVTAGASIVGKAAKIGGAGSKSLKLIKIVGGTAIGLLNPLDGVSTAIIGGGRAIKNVGEVGIKQIRKTRGAANTYDLVAAAKRYDASAIGTFNRGGNTVEGAAVFTGGEWHAYDPASRQAFGTALNDFVPSMGGTSPAFGDWAVGQRVLTDSEKAIKARWDAAVKRSKFGVGKFEFEAAYYSTNPPKDLISKTKNLTAMELMALAQGNDTPAGVMGTLVRQYDSLAFKQGKKTAAQFIDAIDPDFGTVFPLPQTVYLSSTAQFSDGQCAALSRALATAVEQGKEKTLINNLFKAAARPDTAEARAFMRTLSRLQAFTGGESTFHAQKVLRQVTPQDMVRELSRSTVTQSVMIDSPGHAMAAGVVVDGAHKKYYFYDPNAGVAFFPTAEAMEAGLTRLFSDKRLQGQYRTHATHPKRLEFKIFDHDDEWRKLASIDEGSFKTLFDVPLHERAVASMSHERLKVSWETLQKAPGNQGLNCYQASVHVAQAEHNLTPDAVNAVKAATKNGGPTSYTPRYLELMGITPEHLKTTFDAAQIKESGFLNFKHGNEGGAFGHTVYLQKTDTHQLYLFNTNSPDLDVAMIKNGKPIETSGGMTVFHLDDAGQRGLQNFLDGIAVGKDWQFVYTPVSTVTANVQGLTH